MAAVGLPCTSMCFLNNNVISAVSINVKTYLKVPREFAATQE